MGLGEITRQASSFLHDKYKTAKCVLADVSHAELLAEEATNGEPCSPDTRAMTKIAEATFEYDDYWRVVDVLHRRLHNVDFKEWRRSHKTLVLLDFLLTHGPEDMGEEFYCDMDVIQELGSFRYIDDKGFNWGMSMQKKSERILTLLCNIEYRKEERAKAIKISNEIKGFGSTPCSPLSTLSPCYSSKSSRTSCSSTTESPRATEHLDETVVKQRMCEPQSLNDEMFDSSSPRSPYKSNMNMGRISEDLVKSHIWNVPVQETGTLLLTPVNEGDELEDSQRNTNSTTAFGLRSTLSDVGNVIRKKFERQLSFGL